MKRESLNQLESVWEKKVDKMDDFFCEQKKKVLIKKGQTISEYHVTHETINTICFAHKRIGLNQQ